MGKIVEFLTINVATGDLEATLTKWRRLGLSTLPPAHMPEPPVEITDVTLPVGASGAISVIAPTAPARPCSAFCKSAVPPPIRSPSASTASPK